MSVSSHLFDPQKSIRFVKSTETLESTIQDDTATELKGEEIKRFYDDLVSQPSTSHASVKRVQENPIKVEAKNEPIKMAKIGEISERDERLFFKAIEHDDLNSVLDYLSKGININLKDIFGWTPLMCAASAGSHCVVELLLLNGADLEYSSKGLNAEMLARQKKHTEVINYIAEFRSKQVDQEARAEPELIEEMYCTLCKVSHFDRNHDNKITHLVNLNELPDEGYSYGISMSNIGYRLLKKGKWMEGKGLGKDKDGRKYPVRTTLKRDRKGLGLEKNLPQKVTHFESLDPNAVKNAKKPPKRSYIRQLDEQIAKKKQKEISLRRALS